MQLLYCLRCGFIRQTRVRVEKTRQRFPPMKNSRDREHFGGVPVSKTIVGAESSQFPLCFFPHT